jgi:hypothetical protein
MELEPALVERLLFLPYYPQPVFVSKGMNRIPKRWLHAANEVKLPARDASAVGSAWRIDQWMQTPMWREPEIRELIVQGLLNTQQAAVALAEFEALEPRTIADPVKWITKTPYTELMPEFAIVLCSLEPQAFGETLLAWQKRIESDKTGEGQRLFDHLCNEGVIQHAEHGIWPGADGVLAQQHVDHALSKWTYKDDIRVFDTNR